jgi:hypothetical protein
MPTTEDFAEFRWGELGLLLWESPPLVGSTGTQSEEETGRGVGEAGIPSGPRYRIGVFTRKGFGSAYCGGALRDKMCASSDCSIQGHKKKVKDLLSPTGDPEEQVVMIYSVPAANRSASVFLTPRLSPSMFGDKLPECLVVSKAHVSWSMVSEAMTKTNPNGEGRDHEDDTTVTDVLRMTEQGMSFVVSPRSLLKTMVAKSPLSPEDVVIPKMEVSLILVGSQEEVSFARTQGCGHSDPRIHPLQQE